MFPTQEGGEKDSGPRNDVDLLSTITLTPLLSYNRIHSGFFNCLFHGRFCLFFYLKGVAESQSGTISIYEDRGYQGAATVGQHI